MKVLCVILYVVIQSKQFEKKGTVNDIMKNNEIMKHIDHTLLRAYATWEEIKLLCDEAIAYNCASVCVPQTYVERIRKEYGDAINICTVIGFPLGYQVSESKICEAGEAIKRGANEIDMVINITDAKNGDINKIEEEIRSVKKVCGKKILKVIIETCYLSIEEKIDICHAVTNAGADYIKTSTGFGTNGATMEDVLLMKANIGENVKIKAAGGVKSREDLVAFIEAGCDRIGTSSAVAILKGNEVGNY